MRALSLWQPWAWLVATGRKRFETRAWGTRYRGPLVIHASAHWDTDLARLCATDGALVDVLRAARTHAAELPRGAFVGVVELTACYRCGPGCLTNGPALSPFEAKLGLYRRGRYAFALDTPRSFTEPIRGRGMPGLFSPPASVRSTIDLPTAAPVSINTVEISVEPLGTQLFAPGCARRTCMQDAVGTVRMVHSGDHAVIETLCRGHLVERLAEYGLDARDLDSLVAPHTAQGRRHE